MEDLKFYKINIFLKTGKKMMSFDNLKPIIDTMLISTNDDWRIGEINFYNSQENLKVFFDIIFYIRNTNRWSGKITATFASTDVQDDVKKYCVENNVTLVLETSEPSLSSSLDFNEVKYLITKDNVNTLSNLYNNLSKSRVRRLSFDIDSREMISKSELSNQVNELVKVLKERFIGGYSNMLIPQNLREILLSILLTLDMYKPVVKKYNFFTSLQILNANIGEWITVDANMNAFLGKYSPDKLVKETKIGKYGEVPFTEENIEKIYKKIYEVDGEGNINTLSTTCDCSQCNAKYSCHSGCLEKNLYDCKVANKANGNFCMLRNICFDCMYKLMQQMDEAKNETFRDYLLNTYYEQFN